MRIICVIDSLGSGGAQRQLVGVACGLKRRGHEVEMFVYHENGFFKPELSDSEIPVNSCLKGHRFSPAPVVALRNLVKRVRPGAVLAYLETPSLYSEFACIGLRQMRVIVSERNIAHAKRVSLVRRMKSRAHLLADGVVTNSSVQRAWLEGTFPYLQGRVSTIWNGVDVERFRPSSEPVRRPPSRFLGIGRVVPQKNLHYLVDALAESRERGLDISVDWAGRADDASYYRELLEHVSDRGCGTRLRWLGERRDIPELLREYDGLVLPSLWEGLPNVVCEALASGLPAIVSHVSDNPKLVESGVTGLLVDPIRVESLVEAFQKFSGLPFTEVAAWRSNARRFAVENLSMDRCVSAHEAALHRSDSAHER
jgi:glycosyltransferase involved in cell wall biosynthesis